MEKYNVLIKPSASKELDEIPDRKTRRRVVKKIQGLSDDPRPHGREKLTAAEKYRLRQGRYRVVFAVDNRHAEVTIFKISQRKDVYR